MTAPLVSVVIPFQNHKTFLEPALCHLFQQTYPHWELILVDNNAEDGSTEIALNLSQQYPEQVRYIRQSIQGIPFARNKGLAEARGNYVTFLDVDDHFTPTKLSEQVAILEAQPEVAMVYGLTRRVYVADGRSVIQNKGIAQEGMNQPPWLAIDWLRILYHLPQTGATLTRTAVARDIGGFDENLLLGNDDVAYHLKLAFHYPIWFLPNEAVVYYRHNASAGAQLNQSQGVITRYRDIYARWVVPYTAEYQKQTNNGLPYYWAERSLAGNLCEYAYQMSSSWLVRRRLLHQELQQQRQRGYLRDNRFTLLFNLYAWLPYRAARLATKLLYKALYWSSPQNYPLRIPQPTL